MNRFALVVLCWSIPASAQLTNTECAHRVARALNGSANWNLTFVGAPQQRASTQITVAFVDRLASFISSRFNPESLGSQDPVRLRAAWILRTNRPWRDLFVGAYTFDPRGETVPSPNTVGYFSHPDWLKFYAGNEPEGLRLQAAARIFQNTVGVDLAAAANNGDGDNGASGRERSECRGCHFDSPYALDKAARLLSRRVGTDLKTMTFAAPTDGPQTLLGGTTINSERELIEALVTSDAFVFRTCRLAAEFLYGRAESTCDAEAFDQCTARFRAEGTMQSAILGLVEHPSFCAQEQR